MAIRRRRKKAARRSHLVPQKSDGLRLLKVDLSLRPSKAIPEDDFQTTIVDPRPAGPTGGAGFGEVLKVSPEALASFMERSWNAYSNSCVCGTSYANNCAHFLTNAFAVAGATFPSGAAKCPRGRMIRAKETLDWFRSFATGFQNNHNAITGGYWFVYQESGGQGHVCMHLEASDRYWWKGTMDLPSWPVQWHYFH